MNAARGYFTTTLLPNGKVLAVGGYNNSVQNASTEIYDPASGTWAATGALTTRRYSHSATLLSSGKVLVAGGYNDTDGRLSSAELYDPAAGSWSTTGSLSTVHVSFTAPLLPKGKVLAAGGYNGASTNLAELYSPTTGLWAATGTLLKDRFSHTATLLPNGKVLVAAGWSNVEGSLQVAETYDPATAGWTATGNLATARDSHTATLLPNGKVLVAGGNSSSTFSSLGSCELFDPATGTWSSTGSLATARQGHSATLLPDGKVLVSGGTTNNSTPLTSAELYDPANGTWTSVPGLLGARSFHGAVLLPNGNVLFSGGYNFSSYLTSSELFDTGMGFSSAWCPLVTSAPASVVPGNALVITGSGFRGISGASAGTYQDAATNYPLLQLRTLDGGMSVFLPSSSSASWSDTTFTSGVVSGLPYGHALATLFTNGIPSVSSVVDIVSSNNVNLSGLAVASASLSPTFSSGTTSYTSTVPYTTTSVTVTPTLSDSSSSIKVNGVPLSSGNASGAISLAVGANTINTVITAQDGITTKTYSIIVTRAQSANANLSNLALSTGTLSPVFFGGTTSYTATVSNATTSLTITPTVADSTASVKVNGVTVTSGSASGAISLAVGANTINTVVTAQDGTTLKTYSVVVTRAASNNANLSGLALSTGILIPVFSSVNTSYSAVVTNATTSLTITPTVADSTASVKVNGVTVTSGSASGAISLAVGANTINTVVTAQDGTTIKNYAVVVTRAASNNANLSGLALSTGTLNPVFASGTTNYIAAVANATTSLTISPTVADSTASVKVNGVTVTSGSASGSISLAVGANTINTVVTAQDGVTTKTYSINITRAPSANANLSGLALSTGTLSPVFASGTTSYAAAIANATTSLTITPTVADSTASVKVNGVTVTSGSASGSISLAVGANTINTVVTAQDGVTTKTYSINITRAPSTNANLSGLALSTGTLSPIFAAGATNYTAAVVNATSSLTITPILADSSASVKVNGATVTSGSASGAISLIVGDNSINTVVTAQDGVTLKTYTITVTRRTPYQDWALAANINPSTSGAGMDADGDGIPNLLEWAFGTNPTASDAGVVGFSAGAITSLGGPKVMMDNSAGSPMPLAIFGRRLDYVASGLSYTVEFSADLSQWVASGDTPTVQAADSIMQVVSVPFPPTVNGQPTKFFRVKVVGP